MTATSLTAADLRSAIQRHLPDLVAVRRDLHAFPELGYAEERTSGVVQRELKQAGVEFESGLAGGTGVLGHLPGAHDRAVGLRADMDALPILEETGAEWASQTAGCMHACGHDGHTTILLGAARVLAEFGTLPRPVTFCFQPAEEGGAGGKRMVEDGCLNGTVIGPPVENMFGLHGWPRYPLGQIGTRPGPLLAAADMWEMTITGRGCHAAQPQVGHDPIVAAAAIITALQTIASRNVDPLDSVVLSVTKMNGGTAHNIIPEAVRLGGTVRTLEAATKVAVVERLHQIAQAVAVAHGCRAEVDYQDGYPVTRNDAGATTIVTDTLRGVFGDDRVVDVPAPFMGGEDFSFYCQEVPSCFFLMGLCPTGTDDMADLHQPTFDFNDDAIAIGVEAFCRLALRTV